MMKIQQVTSEYHPLADRLLLRIYVDDDAEFQFWLTRRFCEQWVQWLNDLIQDDTTVLGSHEANVPQTAFDSINAKEKLLKNAENKQAIMDFQRDEALSKADFTQTKTKTAAKKPFGEKPLLITLLNSIPQAQGLPMLEISAEDGQGLKISLDPTLMHSLYKLLSEAAFYANWHIEVKASPEGKSTQHLNQVQLNRHQSTL